MAEDTIDLDKMMADVGPLVQATEIRQFEPERWLVVFEDDFVIGVENDLDAKKLVFTTELGAPPAGEEAAAYKLLLNVAAMWRETGGLRMGLDPKDDTVIQIYDLPLAALELEDLARQLQNFAQTAVHARTVLAGSSVSASEEIENLLVGMRV